MQAYRSDMAHRVSETCAPEIFGNLLSGMYSRTELDRKLGWSPGSKKPKRKPGWMLYEVEVLNSDDWMGKMSLKTIFRGNYMRMVRNKLDLDPSTYLPISTGCSQYDIWTWCSEEAAERAALPSGNIKETTCTALADG